jgi:translocation and assembly module TamA
MKRTFLLIFVGFALFGSIGFAAPTQTIALRYQFSGIQNEAVQKNVKAALQNLYGKLQFPLTPVEAEHFMVKAPFEIQGAITPFGFFHNAIHSTLTKNDGAWSVNFAVTEGPALPIAAVDIEILGDGKHDPVFQKWIQHSPLKVGHPLHTQEYENAKTDLFDLATKRGYFSAKMVKNQIQINLARYQSTVVIVFDTGTRSRYGETTFSESPFKTAFLQKYLTYKKGQYYNASDLEKTQEGLVASNYFSQVMIKPDTRDIQKGDVPISVSLIARKAREYTVGLGYGTDTGGVRGTAGVTFRRLGGEGHRLQLLGRASANNNSSFITKYMIPGFNPAKDLITLFGGIGHIEQSTGNANTAKVATEYSTTRDRWKSSIEMAYLNERYNIRGFPNTSTQLVFPSIEVTYANTDHPLNPRNGISIATQVSGASKAVLSETDFFQVTSHFKALYTIEKTRTRLLFRSDVGHTNITNIIRLPLSLQLFAGGARSVRGYDYNSIGPGRNLLVMSGELQERIYKDFYLAGFIDAGTVGNNAIFDTVKAGTGPGVAWISPIGTMELTVAEAFTQPNKPWMIQFTMGTNL